jgi:glycosyltransferase involved in cell wall biosynthesis
VRQLTVLSNVIQKSLKTDEVTCVIPTLNERFTVDEVVRKARLFTYRVVVVDGYSEDGTSEIASKAGADILLQDGKGKGMALRTVFDKVKAGVYVIIDGDATYNAMEMENIVQPILDGKADMVVGSRLKGKMEDGSISTMNRIGNRLFNFLINFFFNGEITDSQSGFRAVSRKAVENMNLSSKGFEVETEMTIKALKQGLKIKEVPITYAKRRGSTSKLNSFKAGSKIFKTIIIHLG